MQGSIKRESGVLYLEETGPANTSVRYKLKEVLYSKRSPYQLIEIADSYDYGRMLVLDGCVNVCERDEAIYHEMIAHIPVLLHPEPANVLVIGGGDGGTVRELLKHNGIKHIDLVEIDADVIEACKLFMPSLASGFSDRRVRIHNEDGTSFVKKMRQPLYSVVIVDSSDPVGPAEGLFKGEFYESCRNIICDNGIVTAQSESPYIYPDVLRQLHQQFSEIFSVVHPYRISMPTYPSGQIYIMLGLCGSSSFNGNYVKKFFSANRENLHYLTPEILPSVFHLPGDVRKTLKR